MALPDDVRSSCAAIAASAGSVRIDLDALDSVEPGPPPALDPERHYLEGSEADVAAYLLTLDTINFGSGWWPTAAGVKRLGSAPASSRQRLISRRLSAWS